jgi:cell wall-associated NlpC family hydrolase
MYGFVGTGNLCEGPSEAIQRPARQQVAQSSAGGAGAKIASTARTWVDRDFRSGQTEQCMYFVREVLHQACGSGLSSFTVSRAWDNLETGPGLASSLAGNNAGTRINSPGQLQVGDIVFFKDTYPGDWPLGTITHVGIYVGNGNLVHRPTAAKPVEQIPVSAYGNKFHSAVRLSSSLTSGCR